MDMDKERRIMKDTMKTYKRKVMDSEKLVAYVKEKSGKRKNVTEEKTKVKKVKTPPLETGKSLPIRMSLKSLYSIIPKLS